MTRFVDFTDDHKTKALPRDEDYRLLKQVAYNRPGNNNPWDSLTISVGFARQCLMGVCDLLGIGTTQKYAKSGKWSWGIGTGIGTP